MGDWLQDRCNEIQKAQQEHIQKSFGSEDIEKARSGVYKPTKQNLKEGKAGQKYGTEKKEDDKKSKVKDFSNIENFNNLDASTAKLFKEFFNSYKESKNLTLDKITVRKNDGGSYSILYDNKDLNGRSFYSSKYDQMINPQK